MSNTEHPDRSSSGDDSDSTSSEAYEQWWQETHPAAAEGQHFRDFKKEEEEEEEEEYKSPESESEDEWAGAEDEACVGASENLLSASRTPSPTPKRELTSPAKASIPAKKRRRGPATSRAKKVDKKCEDALQSTILKLPQGLSAIREHLFLLQSSMTWTAKQFEDFWPFCDNIWVHNLTNQMTRKGTQASYWYCRLWSESKPKGFGHRAKQLRTHPPCGIKLKMLKQFNIDTDLLESVSLSLHIDKKNPCSTHNHTLDFIDTIEVNSYIMHAAGQQVALGYEVADIYRILVGVKWDANESALHIGCGRHLKLIDVHNAGKEWRKLHPDQPHEGAKDAWSAQQQALLEDLQSHGGILSANIEADRVYDKAKSYGTAFASKSK